MKKNVLLFSVAILVMTSCEKTHTCTCNDGYDDYSYTITDTKGKARRTCENKVGVVSFNYDNCHLSN